MSGATACLIEVFSPTSGKSESAACLQQIEREQTPEFIRWNELIESTLTRWSNHPELLDNEESIPPSCDLLRIAAYFAGKLRDLGEEAPVRIVTNGEGGVVFEFENEHERSFRSWEIRADNSLHYCEFEDYRIVLREEFR